MNDVTDQILSELESASKDGLSVADLLDKLGIDPEQITSALKALMSEGRIMQKQETETERYIVRTVLTEDSEPSGLTDMNGCPCFHCLKISRCGVRQPESPVTCRDLEDWLGADIN